MCLRCGGCYIYSTQHELVEATHINLLPFLACAHRTSFTSPVIYNISGEPWLLVRSAPSRIVRVLLGVGRIVGRDAVGPDILFFDEVCLQVRYAFNLFAHCLQIIPWHLPRIIKEKKRVRVFEQTRGVNG